MTHIHWVARQNKLKIPNDEEEVNTREIHKSDGEAHDPDTMVAPLTPTDTKSRSPHQDAANHCLVFCVFEVNRCPINIVVVYYESMKMIFKKRSAIA